MGCWAARLGSPPQLLLFLVNVSHSHHRLYFRSYQDYFCTFLKEPNTKVHFLKKQTMLLILAWSVIWHLPHGSTWSPSRAPPSALRGDHPQFLETHRDGDTRPPFSSVSRAGKAPFIWMRAGTFNSYSPPPLFTDSFEYTVQKLANNWPSPSLYFPH